MRKIFFRMIISLMGSNFILCQVQGQSSGSFTDPRDGKIYKTVQLGTQKWMAENLSFKAMQGCWPKNDPDYVKTYGYLYEFGTAQKVCPEGWHLPTESEWITLFEYLGGQDSAGGKMKEAGNLHWAKPNNGATNSSGFCGLPGEDCSDKNDKIFTGNQSNFWSSTVTAQFGKEFLDKVRYYCLMYNYSSLGKREGNSKYEGYSVRCISNKKITSNKRPEIRWATVPGGSFIMGSPLSEKERNKDESQHKVTLSTFRISVTGVTMAQFKGFVDATGYVTDAEKGTGNQEGSALWKNNKWEFLEDVNWRCDEKGKRRPISQYDYPVLHVSWNDAKAFADWMGCRLPTEAEWEYACRAGTQTLFNTGNCLETTQANFDGRKNDSLCVNGNYLGATKPAGSYPPNAWGIFDMHGNANEWCSDWYGPYPEIPQTNPKGINPGYYKVVRGGNWGDYWGGCRSAARSKGSQAGRSSSIGFRIVSEIKNVSK